MDIEKWNSERFLTDLKNKTLSFQPNVSTVFEVCLYKDVSEVISTEDTRSDEEIKNWIAKAPPLHEGKSPVSQIRIIAGKRVADDPRNALLTIPFSQATFSTVIMENCHLPKTILRTISEGGEAYFSGILAVENSDWRGCVMRMTNYLSNPQNMAIAISWNLDTKLTYALLLGCNERNIRTIRSFLRNSTSAGHPWLLLALFSDLQLQRLTTLRDQASGKLQMAIHEAGLNRKSGDEVIAVRTGTNIQLSVDYDKVTRDVLRNFQDSGYLLQAMIRSRSQVAKVNSSLKLFKKLPKADQIDYLTSHSTRIANYIDLTLSNYDSLIEKARLTTNGSSLVMSAIWNLIAQKDNKINQDLARESKNIAEGSRIIANESKKIAEDSTKLARDSKEIATDSKEIAEDSKAVAEATRWDSTSMKAIATLTMVFLPPTYSATLLGMPMFNWQHKPGEDVMHIKYFRIYLMLAIPLTAVVLVIWAAWLRFYKYKLAKNEKSRKQARTAANIGVTTPL